MSQQSEADSSPLLVNSEVTLKEEPETDDTASATQAAINDSSFKLLFPLRNKLRQRSERGVPPWYKYATVSVFYCAVAASFGALLTGCTLSFPSSALLDLTDAGLRKEYRFDERLSDIFGVSKASVLHGACNLILPQPTCQEHILKLRPLNLKRSMH